MLSRGDHKVLLVAPSKTFWEKYHQHISFFLKHKIPATVMQLRKNSKTNFQLFLEFITQLRLLWFEICLEWSLREPGLFEVFFLSGLTWVLLQDGDELESHTRFRMPCGFYRIKDQRTTQICFNYCRDIQQPHKVPHILFEMLEMDH